MATAGGPDYDALYHRLFSHPGVVAQLLRGFVAGPWLDDLDLDGMERLNSTFHAETGEHRRGDMIWRIPRRTGEDSYLVLLLEFQSTSDRYMALRLLHYAVLLWQLLVREGRLGSAGKLPPLLPVVIYNGDARWGAAVAVRDLVGLPEVSALWRWQPDLRYHLIDAGAFDGNDLAARDGLPALWFRLETAADPAAVAAVVDDLLAWLAGHPDYAATRAVFADFLAVMTPSFGAKIPIPEEWLEMQSRLWERAKVWTEEWRQEGLHEGVQRGEATLLLRLLERRFGPLPDWAADRVRAADIATLEEWGLRMLDAASLNDVLDESPA
jgi:hypothetical protein